MQPSDKAERQNHVLGTSRRLAIAGLMATLLLTACSGTAPRASPSVAPGGALSPSAPPSPTWLGEESGWQHLPASPLSARHDALGVYLDGVVLALGGSDAMTSGGPYFPPTLRDSAALDLSTRTWRQIAIAPWAPAESAAHIVVGDRVLLARNGAGAWSMYDSSDDSWSSVPAPPVQVPQPTMAALGQRVFVLDKYVVESPAPVQVLDLSTNTWSALPASAHRPAIDDRTVVATDQGLVVMGGDLSPRQAGRHRQPALAETWDGSRWTRFRSNHAAGLDWHWTGHRIISTYRVTKQQSARGGLHEFRAAAFDPATGEWDQLPCLPPRQYGLLEESRATGWGPRVLSQGYLYDDRTGVSRSIKKPSDWGSPTQVLTDDAIVLFGGARPKGGQVTSRMVQLDLTNEAWLLRTGDDSMPRVSAGRHQISSQRAATISAGELAKAVALARQEIYSQHATISSATVTAGSAKVLESNTGHPCKSGRVLNIKLIGSFPHIVTTGLVHRPDEPPSDFTVRAMLITTDARSGLACLIGVQTDQGGQPEPEPNAAVLDIN
jgi:hypothetical protein